MQAVSRLSSASRRATVGISKEGLKSSIQIRGKSNVSSVADESLKPQKLSRRIVAKQERKAMVISYIEKYKALNEGKIPGPEIIKKEVGGSFYVIREIVQELLYKQKMSQGKESDGILSSVSVEKEKEKIKQTVQAMEKEKAGVNVGTDSEAKGVKKERVPVRVKTAVGEVANAKISRISGKEAEEVKEGKKVKLDSTEILQESPTKVEPNSREEFELKEDEKMKLDSAEILQESPAKVEPNSRDEFEVKEGKRIKLDSAEILQERPTKFEPKMRGEYANSEPPQGEYKSERKHEESSEPAGKLWGNLKSLADGIINFWKKF